MFPFPLFTVQSPLTPTAEASHMPTPVSGISLELGELSSNLSCFIMELDLLVKQVIQSSCYSDCSRLVLHVALHVRYTS